MSDYALPPQFQQLDRLLQADKLEAAGAALAELRNDTGAESNAERQALLESFEIQLAVSKGEMAPALAQTRLVAVMRRVPQLTFARELYQRISQRAYQGAQASMAHSHPPPPKGPEGDEGP